MYRGFLCVHPARKCSARRNYSKLRNQGNQLCETYVRTVKEEIECCNLEGRVRSLLQGTFRDHRQLLGEQHLPRAHDRSILGQYGKQGRRRGTSRRSRVEGQSIEYSLEEPEEGPKIIILAPCNLIPPCHPLLSFPTSRYVCLFVY